MNKSVNWGAGRSASPVHASPRAAGVRRLIRVVLVVMGTAFVLAGTTRIAGAQPAPTNSLSTDAAQFLPGAVVTVTGSGWTCSFDGFSVTLTLFEGTTPIDSVFPTVTAGSFTQTFTAPTALGSYSVEATDQACGSRTVIFEVVAALPTTTTTTTTTTTATTGTTSAVEPITTSVSLPETGGPTLGPGLAGGLLVVMGIGFVVVTRRRAVG